MAYICNTLLLQMPVARLCVWHKRELCKNGWNDREPIWGMWARGTVCKMVSRFPHWQGQFWGSSGPWKTLGLCGVQYVAKGYRREAGIPRDWHGHRHRHGHPRRLPREDRREDVGVSAATSPFSLPRAGHARWSSPTCPTRRAIFLARILARMSVSDTRVYTCRPTRMQYTISYRVHVYKITR